MEQQSLIDSTIKDLLEQRERFADVVRRIIKTVVLPRMEELSRHFDNSVIKEHHGDDDFHCACCFDHTPRFPATVSLDVSLLPGGNTNLSVKYVLEIFPVLMEYKRDEETVFPFEGSEEEIGLWIEDKIVAFVDTYLRLETHPLYQKDNIVTDIVCGMRISSIAATSSAKRDGRTVYFCSDHCKDAFIKQNG